MERKRGFEHTLIRLGGIIAGSFIYACGISLFLDPNNLAPGGVVGLSVILSRLIPVETGTLYFILNIPILLLGLWRFGFKFISSTFLAIICNSFFTNLLGRMEAVTTEPLLAALAGSILVGTGIGVVFKCRATTGGMDIIIKILRTKYRHLKTGSLFLMMDVIVVSISGIVFKDFNIAMYALIAVTVAGRVMDYVLYGGDEAKLIYIISDHPEQIVERVMREAEAGVTYLTGKGAYSNREKQVIMCVARKQQSPVIEEIIKQVDKNAFMIVTGANEIYGEGYKNIMSERL